MAYLTTHALEIAITVVMVVMGVFKLLVAIIMEIAVDGGATAIYIITAYAVAILVANPTVLNQV